MIVDIYLRADSRAAIDVLLDAAGLIDDEGRPASIDVRLSRIASMARPTGTFDADGAAIMADVPGYHANLRLLREATDEELALLAPVTIDPPATPYRVWFD